MSLSVGIVGLPNVGKSTLFNALLKKQLALAANYPFATIEPNVGVVAVPDERLARLARVVEQSEKVTTVPQVPATVEFVDIAGIVAGAAKGEGLGNKFLSHIREVDLVAHVVRDFSDPDVVLTGKGLEDDYQTIISELILKDLETVEKSLLSAKKDRSISGQARAEVLTKLVSIFNQSKLAATVLSSEELEQVADLFLLSAKPQILVVNVDESRVAESASVVEQMVRLLNIPSTDIVVVSAKIEAEVAELEPQEAQEFLAELGLGQSGLERLAKTSYERLGLSSFLTAGAKEVRAWTIKQGTKAPQAAGVIHTDFIKKFIKASVVSVADFGQAGGWKAAAEQGKVRLEGRDYIMREDDVVDFKIGS